MHRDHHIEVAKALYSVPGNLIGARVEVRADRPAGARSSTGASWSRSIPARRPGGARPTPTTCPADKTVYAMRDLDRLRRMAAAHGPAIGAYAAALLDIPLAVDQDAPGLRPAGPGQEVGRRAGRGGLRPGAGAEAVNVGLIGRMLERGTEQHAHRAARPVHRTPSLAGPASPATPTTSPLATRGGCRHERPAADRQHRAQSRCCAGSSSAAASTPSPNASPWPRPASLGHAEFLELVLADEVTRRETTSADRRARAAGLDPTMTLERWDDTAKVTYDHAVWNELCSLRFVDAGHNAVIMGPVGVGKTFLATALGHAASPPPLQRPLRTLRPAPQTAPRRPASTTATTPRCASCSASTCSIIDDFALQPLDPLDTADIYELIVERHRAAATVVTSNREPIEWLGQMADPLLAQSAIDRLQSAAHELVLDGESYRRRQKPGLDIGTTTPRTRRRRHP